MTHKLNSVPTYRTYPSLSMAADAVQTTEIRTNTYNNVDAFQLRRFCSSRVSHVRRNVYKMYPDVLNLSGVTNCQVQRKGMRNDVEPLDRE